MNFDPGDPKNVVLYSMMTDDKDEEIRGGPGCGCPTAGLVILLFFVLVILALLRL